MFENRKYSIQLGQNNLRYSTKLSNVIRNVLVISIFLNISFMKNILNPSQEWGCINKRPMNIQ